MKNIMEYKGYLGSVEFSEEDEMFFAPGHAVIADSAPCVPIGAMEFDC